MAFTYKPYEESDAVKAAREQLAQTQAAKPGAFSSQWTGQLQQTAQQIQNRQPFRYDLNNDPLYDQLRQRHTRQGKMAMADTIGQAAAMNGGYGSSYGQSVGQQTYNSHMQQLNDRIPELYNMALSRYQAEGADLLNRFNVLGSMEQQDYGRHQDAVNAWQNDRNYWQGRADVESDRDYGRYEADRGLAYQQDRDAEADRRYQTEWDYGVAQDKQKLAQAQVDYFLSIGKEPPADLLEQAGYSKEYADTVIANRSTGGGGGGKKPTSTLGLQALLELANGKNPVDVSKSLFQKYKDGEITAQEYSTAYKESLKLIDDQIVRVPGGGVVNGVLTYKK